MDILNTELPKYGIKMKIDSYENMLTEFKKIITSEKLLSDNFTKFEYLNNKKDFKIGEVNFKFIRTLESGGYNATSIYINEKTNVEVVVREKRTKYSINEDGEESIKKYTEDIFNILYSNMKHIILHILVKRNNIKIKFIPIPYYCVLNSDISSGNFDFFMIMEKGEQTLKNYIENLLEMKMKNELRSSIIKQYFLSIYSDLYLLEFINFRHGDLKINNIVLTLKANPMLIDFDYSQFNIGTLVFKSIRETEGIHYDKPYFNQVHDIMQLIVSLNILNKGKQIRIDPYKIFKFFKNNNTNILDGDLLKSKLKQFIDEENKKNIEAQIARIRETIKEDPSEAENYKDYENLESRYLKSTIYNSHLFNYFYDQEIDLRKLSNNIVISPEQLAENLGLEAKDDYLAELYEKKYVKYKMKYLQLKKLLNIFNKI
jgi:serine/threonine protein kinase